MPCRCVTFSKKMLQQRKLTTALTSEPPPNPLYTVQVLRCRRHGVIAWGHVTTYCMSRSQVKVVTKQDHLWHRNYMTRCTYAGQCGEHIYTTHGPRATQTPCWFFSFTSLLASLNDTLSPSAVVPDLSNNSRIGAFVYKELEIYLFITFSTPALGPTQPPTQWVPGALSLWIKRPGREADHSPPSSAKVKNAWSYASSTPLIRLHAIVLN